MGCSPAKRSGRRQALVSVIALLCTLLSTLPRAESGNTVYVACAANFFAPLKKLVADYKQHHNIDARILISSGSSGSLFRQIQYGSPHHLFLSADSFFPEKLEQAKRIMAGSRKTYAIGELVLWHPGATLNSLQELTQRQLTLAIANPKTAPYGQAAQAILNTLDPARSWPLITGTSIAQTYQFVASGNVPAGFISRSQVTADMTDLKSIPTDWYQPLVQQMVLTRKAENTPQAMAFFHYLESPEAHNIIRKHGYRLPTDKPSSTTGLAL